jgi:hypothetical protein
MVKFVICLLFVCLNIEAGIYEKNCVTCHKKMPVKIDKFFYRYLLKYSSEKSVKASLFNYLKNPTKEKSILPEGLLNRFGVKDKTTLDDKALKEAIDEYWDKYKVFGKLQ